MAGASAGPPGRRPPWHIPRCIPSTPCPPGESSRRKSLPATQRGSHLIYAAPALLPRPPTSGPVLKDVTITGWGGTCSPHTWGTVRPPRVPDPPPCLQHPGREALSRDGGADLGCPGHPPPRPSCHGSDSSRSTGRRQSGWPCVFKTVNHTASCPRSGRGCIPGCVSACGMSLWGDEGPYGRPAPTSRRSQQTAA